MKANGMGRWIVIAMLVGLMWVLGCGSSNQTVQNNTSSEDAADIDELLGLKETPQEEPKPGQEQENLAEDDVLKLLGVTDPDAAGARPESQDQPQVKPETGIVPETTEPAFEPETGAMKTETRTERPETVPYTEPGAERDVVKPKLEWKGDTYQERYQEALEDYRGRRYRDAIQKFEALLVEDTGNNLADNCQYWIGESYWGLNNYQQAIMAFYKVFSFRNSNKNPDSQLKIGLCYLRMKENEKAKEELQKVIDNYPASEFVGTAKRFLRELE